MGLPFLLYLDRDDRPRLHELVSEAARVTIGRRTTCDLSLPWDDEVSRLHAELLQMGADWVVCDDGLSHNGTFLNGARVRGRRRLDAGDILRVGSTTISVCEPERATTSAPTRAARSAAEVMTVTAAQRRLLAVLCRPMLEGSYSAPASNREIADELVLSIDTVKGTLSALFDRFGLTALPQNQKRSALAVRALAVVRADR